MDLEKIANITNWLRREALPNSHFSRLNKILPEICQVFWQSSQADDRLK